MNLTLVVVLSSVVADVIGVFSWSPSGSAVEVRRGGVGAAWGIRDTANRHRPCEIGVGDMRCQRKNRLSDTELRALGLTPNLVSRKARSAASPDARKNLLLSPRRQYAWNGGGG